MLTAAVAGDLSVVASRKTSSLSVPVLATPKLLIVVEPVMDTRNPVTGAISMLLAFARSQMLVETYISRAYG
jgi:hypothetical protein